MKTTPSLIGILGGSASRGIGVNHRAKMHARMDRYGKEGRGVCTEAPPFPFRAFNVCKGCTRYSPLHLQSGLGAPPTPPPHPPGGRNVHLLSTSTRSGSIPSLEKANFEGIVQSNIDLWPLGSRRLTVVEFYVVKEILPAETLSSHSKKNSAGINGKSSAKLSGVSSCAQDSRRWSLRIVQIVTPHKKDGDTDCLSPVVLLLWSWRLLLWRGRSYFPLCVRLQNTCNRSENVTRF